MIKPLKKASALTLHELQTAFGQAGICLKIVLFFLFFCATLLKVSLDIFVTLVAGWEDI